MTARQKNWAPRDRAASPSISYSRARPMTFGYLRIRVQVTELVALRHERIENRVMVEALGEREPPRVPRACMKFGQRLVHAAELGPEHRLHLRFVERCERTLDVAGEGKRRSSSASALPQ